ncbi:interferon-induced protein 44-like [Polypterus senegalus]|uniref:interferon-induced protein 44-like n=1 Tax=Polypterus senegalus TaxID=55291 RepID=UPI00196441BB|nr:interferon-induced protein 44-like [Polypterus senegalus]
MSSVIPRLDKQTEKQLLSLFEGHVKFSLLYKGSLHGFSVSEIGRKSINQGCIIMVGYLEDDVIVGGCTSQWLRDRNTTFKDEKAFYFSIEKSKVTRTPVESFTTEYEVINFENGLKFHRSKTNTTKLFVTRVVYMEEEEQILQELEVYRVEDLGDLLDSPWRELCWNEEMRDQLKNSIINYKPPLNLVSKTRVLLVGPVGAGKSSFISSVGSVFHGWVALRAMVGTAVQSFTNMFRSYNTKSSQGGEQSPLVLCDMMGLGGEDLPGVKVNDVLQAVKGHVPEGYKFDSSHAICSDTSGYVSSPGITNKIACVAFAVDARKVQTYPDDIQQGLKELRLKIRDLGVPQLALLTHIDEVCHGVDKDVSRVYLSRHVQDKVTAAGNLLGLPVSCIVPVKNYSSELELDCSTDILILKALELILRYADLFYDDYDFFKAIQ